MPLWYQSVVHLLQLILFEPVPGPICKHMYTLQYYRPLTVCPLMYRLLGMVNEKPTQSRWLASTHKQNLLLQL